MPRGWLMLLRTLAMKHIYWLSLILFASSSAFAQTGSLHGQVTDQNGGVVAGAKVTVHGLAGAAKATTSDGNGSYSFTGLAPGNYTVEASAPSLVLQDPVKINLRSGTRSLNLQLSVVIPEQNITVPEN